MITQNQLVYVPLHEIDRLRALHAPKETVTALFADLCRINTLYMISFAGSGHAGSSLSAMDIVSHLYLDRMHNPGGDNGDVYFSSKGHDAPGLYSVLIGLGLLAFDRIHTLRRLDGLPGHPDVETPHIATNTGSLGMGISKAKGMIFADRLRNTRRNYYVMLGDGELQEGQIWESMQPAANARLGELTVIVDHNKLQSDTFVNAVSGVGDIEKRAAAHGWAVARCDGHDIAALGAALDALQANVDTPKFLIADTVKGKGAAPMESTRFKAPDRLYKFHSGAPAPDIYAEAVNDLMEKVNGALLAAGAQALAIETVARPETVTLRPPQKLIAAYADALVEQASRNENVVALSADLALDTGLLLFEEKFPERFFECGIAEQDMVSMAGGMALKGFTPVVHSFACFLASRPNEHIFNNATERTKIIYVGSLAGVVPGGPGHSHQSVRDIGALSGVPGMTMLEPCCEAEVAMAFDYAVNQADGPVYIRLVSIPVEIPYTLPTPYRFERGRGCVLTEGGDVLAIGYGPVTLSEAVKAAAALAGDGVSMKVVNLPWLNRIDEAWLEELAREFNLIVTLDNHCLEGGQGRMIRSELTAIARARETTIMSFGVTGVVECGRNEEVLAAHGLDAASMHKRIMEAVKR